MLFVTHDVDAALVLADRVIVLPAAPAASTATSGSGGRDGAPIRCLRAGASG
jgi:ABC-type nitrate/sulfonate/bicarbonate transport system ATPase subunit